MDILYFAKVNNLLSSLRTRLISELDGRCKIPIRRIATYDELRQRRNCLAEELRETGEDSSSDYTVRWLDRILNPHNQNTKESKIRLQLSIHWTAEDGTILCFPDLIDSVIPRQPHEHDQITCWLGAGIEKALKDYCQTSSPNQKVISVVYKRNRVKDFIGTDIALPQKYALHDDLDFSTFNPDKLADWIDQMVDKFGPHDLGSELALPTTLTPQQYRAYRIVKKVAEYIFRGPLTYDTPIKKQMLVRTQGLHAPPSYLMLPCLKK